MNISSYIIPLFIIIIFLTALIRKTKAYDSFLTGVRGGLKTSLNIFPSMFGMYICINMLDKSGLIDLVFQSFNEFSDLICQALFRPFSSQASLGFMLEVYKKQGVDSPLGLTASILQGSSDAAIYVMSLYLGAYNIKKTKKCYFMGVFINILSFIITLLVYIIFYKL